MITLLCTARKRLGFSILCLAGVSLLLAVWATSHGPGVSWDSLYYFTSARSTAAGHGPYGAALEGDVPPTHYPPGFAFLLAALSWCGLELPTAARVLNCSLFAVNVSLVGLLIATVTRGSIAAAIIGGSLAMLNPALLKAHAFAWSEPAFLTLLLCCILMLGRYLKSDHRGWLVAAALTIGMSVVVRYAGLAFVAGGGLAVLLLCRAPNAQRLVRASVFVGIALIPYGALIMANRCVNAASIGRSVEFHPVGFAHLRAGLRTFSLWLFPLPTISVAAAAVVAGAGAICLAVLVIRLRRSPRGTRAHDCDESRLTSIMLILGSVYVAFLLVVMSLMDRGLSFEPRILLPVFIFGLALVAKGVRLAWERSPRIAGRGIVALPVAVVAVAYLTMGLSHARSLGREPAGFAGPTWAQSPVLGMVQTLPQGQMVYSDLPVLIFWYTQRPARALPWRNAEDIAHRLEDVSDELAEHDGVIVMFNQSHSPLVLKAAELRRLLPLRECTQLPDVTVLKLASEKDRTFGPS